MVHRRLSGVQDDARGPFASRNDLSRRGQGEKTSDKAIGFMDCLKDNQEAPDAKKKGLVSHHSLLEIDPSYVHFFVPTQKGLLISQLSLLSGSPICIKTSYSISFAFPINLVSNVMDCDSSYRSLIKLDFAGFSLT